MPERIYSSTITISDQVYTGSEIKPTPVLTFNGKNLTAGKDYKVTSYSDNINTDYGELRIEGMGNFKDATIRSFKILPADISKASFNYTKVVYKRYYKWEGFTVKYNSVTLKEGTDYTATLQSADGLTATWKVTGKGNFLGEKTVTQTLLPLDLNDFVADAYVSGSYTYTGSSIKPASVSFYTSEGTNPRLEANVDYKLTYGTNINAGQGTVTVAGIGKYKGSMTVNFTINKRSISSTEIADIAQQIYTGSPITPDVNITYNGKTLVKDKDYTLTYSKNTAAGTATIRIDGIGNFYSYQTKTFKIVEIHDVSVADIPDIVCDYGKRPTPIPEVTIDGKKGVLGTDYTISWDFGSEPACKAYVYIRVTKETITKPFALKYDIASVTVSDISDVIATGSAMEPEVTIIAGTTVLTEGKHYTLSYSDNISEGTGIVTITGINNFTGSREVSFTILAPTSTPTQQPTETPTATPTASPEETATPVPTEGPSDNPGLTATPVPTGPDATVTATPVPSTTAEPAVSATPSPAETTQAPSSTDTDPAGTGSDSATPGPAVSAAPVPTDSNTAVIKGNTYKITGKKTAALLKAAKKAKLTVPATVKIRGKKYKVTAILNKAAINNKKLKKIVIGKNVRKIGKKAFAGCRKVKTVQFKTKKISSVGKNAFKGINSKAKFIFKGNAAKIKKQIRKSGYKKI